MAGGGHLIIAGGHASARSSASLNCPFSPSSPLMNGAKSGLTYKKAIGQDCATFTLHQRLPIAPVVPRTFGSLFLVGPAESGMVPDLALALYSPAGGGSRTGVPATGTRS